MNLVEAVDLIAKGDPPQAAVALLGKAFRRYLADPEMSPNTLLNAPCHKGLRTAVREHRWRAAISEAVALIDHPGATNHSLAVIISAEFSRLGRSHREPVTPLAKTLARALAVHPNGGQSVSALAEVVGAVRPPSKPLTHPAINAINGGEHD